MATGRMILFPGGGPPDATDTGNNPASFTFESSSGTQTANTPKARQAKLLFNADTDEHWEFSFIMPGDYSSGGTLRGVFKMTSATSGTVKWKGGQVSTLDSSTDDDAKVFVAADVASNATVPGTQGQTVSFTIALTMTGASANRHCTIFVGRDADDGTNDTATGDAELLSLTFEYTAA